MFERAYKEGYAIGAFNVNNMEIVQGITEACGGTFSVQTQADLQVCGTALYCEAH